MEEDLGFLWLGLGVGECQGQDREAGCQDQEMFQGCVEQ